MVKRRPTKRIDGKLWQLVDFYTEKEVADEEKLFKEARGYKAVVKNVPGGWEVYYR